MQIRNVQTNFSIFQCFNLSISQNIPFYPKIQNLILNNSSPNKLFICKQISVVLILLEIKFSYLKENWLQDATLVAI